MNSRTCLAAMIALASLALPATRAAAEAHPTHLIFLDPTLLAPAQILPPPVAPDSPQGKAELAEVKSIVAAASPERHAQAEADSANEDVFVFGDVVPGLDAVKLPMTRKLFEDVRNDEDFESKAFKAWFARRRPYQVDPSIPVCKDETSQKPTSYPSGHATMGYAMAVVLAHLIPAKADLILARARLYAENRMVCGVHFRSDLAAGQTLGSIVAIQLMQDPDFQVEYAAAKAELKAAGLTD